MLETTDYRASVLTLILLGLSTVLWIDVIRHWMWPGSPLPVEERRKVPWGPLIAVAFVVLVLLCVSAVMQQLFHLPPAPPHTVRHLQVNSVLAQVIELLLLPLLLCMWCPCQWGDFGLRRTALLEDVRFAIWGLLLAQLPVHLVSYPLRHLRADNPHTMLQFLRDSQDDYQVIFWIFIAVAVMAPLVEEFLFRVLLQGALERELSPLWAIILTAAAFVSVHENVVDWAPLLPLALILGYVYYRRHSYLSVVLLHGMFNGISLLCAVWSLKNDAV
jgi:membrane protease YdiL (CAAX protease family)